MSSKTPECRNLFGEFYGSNYDGKNELILKGDGSFNCDLKGLSGNGKWECFSNEGHYFGKLIYDTGDKVYFFHDNQEEIYLDSKIFNGEEIKLESTLIKKK